MPSVEYDLQYLQAGITTLEKYLLSGELYWPTDATAPAGEPPYPRLTLESLLLSYERLQAQALSLTQEASLAQYKQQLHTIRLHWLSAWRKKATRSFRSRLNLWRNYLDEYRYHPEANADRYPYEVRQRVMVYLLKSETDHLDNLDIELLSNLDNLLKGILKPGKFVWSIELQTRFDRKTFWYLYGYLPKEVNGFDG